jgi:tartrate-resistant acid phosphatase type 5
MARAASRSRPDFVVSTGDNFRDDGVANVDDRHFEESFESVYGSPALNLPWYAVLGNHDYRGDVQAQIAYTRRSDRWRMPSRYFARRFRTLGVSATVAFLDTTPQIRRYHPGGEEYAPGVIGQNAEAQLRWLDAVLGRCDTDWKIVVGHHPLMPGTRPASADEHFRARLAPLLEKHGVQVYISGHENGLMHREQNGRHHVVSGAGSKCMSPHDGAGATASFRQLGFAQVRLSSEVVEVALCDASGAPLHEAVAYRRDFSRVA